MTKMIQLTATAYERLKNAKRPGESFSQVVMRLTSKETSSKDAWDRLADIWQRGHLKGYDKMRRELHELDMKSAWDDVQR